MTNIRIWKHSHGTQKTVRDLPREELKAKRLLTLHGDTARNQGQNFRSEMRRGDFFYLCHGNDVQLLGRITSGVMASKDSWTERNYDEGWIERKYRLLVQASSGRRYGGPPKVWAPSGNTTCWRVPDEELGDFERLILTPFFHLRVRDLKPLGTDPAVNPEQPPDLPDRNAVLSASKRYPEGGRRLRQHYRVERNQALVRDAKRLFKQHHGRLFCEICGFDFIQKYGTRGRDFIEAHHRKPIMELDARTSARTSELAMVCSNCHRMLHRTPWITVDNLRRSLLAGPQTALKVA